MLTELRQANWVRTYSLKVQRNWRVFIHVIQIAEEKVMKIEGQSPDFTVISNKNTYHAQVVVVAIGYSNTFAIEGLMDYVENHGKAIASKQRIQLKTTTIKSPTAFTWPEHSPGTEANSP
jgi:thioredoxin reductase